MRRSTLRSVRLPLVTAALLLLALPGVAAADDGRRWPGRTITYHESPRDLGVRAAAKAWNRSGVDIRFRRVSLRRRADVFVAVGPEGCAGSAQLGYAPGRQAFMHVLRCPRWDQTLVAAHEFGHILGLGHERRRCALMNPVLVNGAPSRCEQPSAAETYRCRVFERHDLRRAARKYGGRPKVPPRRFCDLYDPPSSVTDLVARRINASTVEVSLRAPAPPRRRVQIFEPGEPAFVELELGTAPGPCPADPAALLASPAVEQDVAYRDATTQYVPAEQGPQCVAARVVDGRGRPGPAVAVAVSPGA